MKIYSAGPSIHPSLGNFYSHITADLFPVDLNKDGIDEIIYAARSTNYPGTTYSKVNIYIFGWDVNKKNLVNQTDKWFSERENVIVGTEPTVLFGNFTGSDNVDIFMAQSADRRDPVGPGIIFKNNGDDTLSKISLGGTDSWSHAAATYDVNSDGLSDVISVSYTDNSFGFLGGLKQEIFSNLNKNFSGIDDRGREVTGIFGSGIAVGDFLNNGKIYAVIGDCWDVPSVEGSFGRVKIVELYVGKNYDSITASSERIMGIIPSTSKILPLPYLDSDAAKRAGLSELEFIKTDQSNYSHDIRVLSLNLNIDNLPDIAVISRPQAQDNNWAAVPEGIYVTFYENLGDGNFSIKDVYIKQNFMSYNAYLRDVTGDGLTDLILSGQRGSAVILKAETQSNGEITYSEIEAKKIELFDNLVKSRSGDGFGPVNIARAPNDEFYLIGVRNRGEKNGQLDDIYYSTTGDLFSKVMIASVVFENVSIAASALYRLNNGSIVIAKAGLSSGDLLDEYVPLKSSPSKNYVLPKTLVALSRYPESGYGLLSQAGTVFSEQKFSEDGIAKGKVTKLTTSQLLSKEAAMGTDLDGDGNIGDAIVAVLDEDGDATQEDLSLFQTLSGALVIASTELGEGDPITEGLTLKTSKTKALTLKGNQEVLGMAQKDSGNWEILIQAGKAISAQTFDAATGVAKGKTTVLKTAQLDAREYYYNLDLTGDGEVSLVGQEAMPLGWSV